MNSIGETTVGIGYSKADAAPTRAARYAEAARRMRRGRAFVVAGFVVSVLGIVAYCVACFAAGTDAELGVVLLQRPGILVGPTLGVIGLGTLLWLVGSFVYLSGAMDADPDGTDVPL